MVSIEESNFLIPSSMAMQTSKADRDPLNLSAAIITLIFSFFNTEPVVTTSLY